MSSIKEYQLKVAKQHLFKMNVGVFFGLSFIALFYFMLISPFKSTNFAVFMGLIFLRGIVLYFIIANVFYVFKQATLYIRRMNRYNQEE